MKMAFRRKDIKKQYYYVWFLGAKESKGLRGEQYILPVLRQLVNIERKTQPCKVTIQISSKGIKIIQNVPKKPNGQQPHLIENNHPPINQSNGQINNTSSTNSSNKTQQQHNSTVKMEQIKHFIPHHAITCALQSEDVVCIILLLYNPLTGCPVHVHGYRCDSIETAFTLRNQLQLLIERPENQKKFVEIESRLASKGLLSQQQLLNNVNQNIIKQQIIKTNQITNGSNDYTSSQQKQQILNKNKSIHQTTQLIYTATHHDSANRSKHNNTLTSDGRSAEDECNQSDGYSPTIRSEPDGQTSLNKSLVESKSSSGNSSGSSPPPQAQTNPVVIEMYENLAQELKTKLSNPSEFGPLLLPPRDYDTVCRSQGKLVELDKRACTNKLLVGKTAKKNDKEIKKPDNLILDTKEIRKKELEIKNDKRKIEDKKTVEVDSVKVNEKKITDLKNDQLNKMETIEMNKIKKMNKEELNEQEKRLNHQQIREQQKQYEQKLKNLQRKQELYEQHQLLIEQQKQVRRELSQQHKPSKFIEGLANGKINKTTNSKDQQVKNAITEEIKLSSTTASKSNNCIINETSAVINTGGNLKQIGSNLANKIKQSLIGSNKDKLQPQLICHKTIHDSLQSLNKLTTTQLSNDGKFIMNKNLKLSTKNLQTTNEQNNKEQQLNKSSNKNLNNSKTKLSNSSSNINALNAEKLNTINSRSDSSNVSKSISSGIGSGANLHTNHKNNNSNYDQLQYLNSSTDEELDDEILIDEYMPNDYVYNRYLNNNINNEEDDEIVDDLDDDEEISSNRVVRRMEMREKLLLLEKNKKNKLECSSTGERVQMTSSEEDDGVNYAITYDENLLPKINTVKKQSPKPIKTDKKLTNNLETKNSKNSSKIHLKSNEELKNSISNHSNQNLKSSINQVKRSETYYEMNSDQKKMFHHSNNNNFYFPSSLTNKSPTVLQQQQPKLFYFPNPDFKAAQQQKQHLIKQPQLYHLGQQPQQILNNKQCEIRRQKSTGNLNGKFNHYHPILMNNPSGSIEKLMNNEFYHHRKPINLDNNFVQPNLVYQRRPISMVNIQPDSNFRVHHQDKLIDPMFNKRVPIYY